MNLLVSWQNLFKIPPPREHLLVSWWKVNTKRPWEDFFLTPPHENISWSRGEFVFQYPHHEKISWSPGEKFKNIPPPHENFLWSRGEFFFFKYPHHENISWSRGKHRNGSIPYLRDHENQIYHVMNLLVSWWNLLKIPPPREHLVVSWWFFFKYSHHEKISWSPCTLTEIVEDILAQEAENMGQ